MSKFHNALLASLALSGALVANVASAQQIVALVGDNTLALIDPAKRQVTASIAVKDVKKLHGIDVRPADGRLYGITDDGMIVTIDPKTGVSTKKAELSEKVKAGTVTVDFNPAADRLRIMSSDGTNLRVNVDDGKAVVDGSLKFADSDMHKGEKPNVVAGAYTNSVKGTKETALYDIDATIGALLKQVPPNDGVLNAVGKLGFKPNGPIAFNIVGENDNAAWLVNGTTLYSVDLASGKATSKGTINGVKGQIRDIGWLPKEGM
jgi:hypothetical protein